MTNRSEAFGRLLKAGISSIVNCEGKKAPIIEDELGQLIGVSGDSIQRYKAGYLPPEPRTVQILAEAAIRRGFLGGEWLGRFLHAARYPFAEKLLDQLCPIGPARPRPPRVYENLPAPTYSQFVMREQAFAEVIDGLSKRSAAVLLVGLGGNGKTSLAREIASACLMGNNAPQFDAVVWVSDKDRPGTTNLSVLLDEIARTLDYPGFTQFEHEEKRREVEQLLRRQRVLLVVDNFETITDGALLTWLLSLPEPSKALITTREYRREFRRGGWPVDLRGMTEAEAKDLIAERVRALKIERLAGDLAQLEPLLIATGGNPKALEITLGLLKYERRPLQQVVDDLYAARGELFDDLFTRAWALLDEAARRVLLVMTFFPTSASAEALRATSDVRGFAFDHAVERLNDLALLDIQQVDLNSSSRYALHPLVRAFAGSKMAEQFGLEIGARERWVYWYRDLSSSVGFCWDDLSKLELLDSEQETIYSAIEWTCSNNYHHETISIAEGCTYYFHIRGRWNKLFSIVRLVAQAALILSNPIVEAKALAYSIQVLDKQGRIADAEKILPRLHAITQTLQLPGDIFFEVQHAIALFWRAQGDLDAAQQAWISCLHRVDQLSPITYSRTRQWWALCLFEKGELEEAQRIFREILHDATLQGYQRYIMNINTHLAAIDIEQLNYEDAAQQLAESSNKARQYQDRQAVAQIQHRYARLHTLRGDIPAARAALAEAIDLFERLGMRRELAEARAAMADLDADEQPALIG